MCVGAIRFFVWAFVCLNFVGLNVRADEPSPDELQSRFEFIPAVGDAQEGSQLGPELLEQPRVRNQGHSGTCYAHAAVNLLEGMLQKHDPHLRLPVAYFVAKSHFGEIHGKGGHVQSNLLNFLYTDRKLPMGFDPGLGDVVQFERKYEEFKKNEGKEELIEGITPLMTKAGYEDYEIRNSVSKILEGNTEEQNKSHLTSQVFFDLADPTKSSTFPYNEYQVPPYNIIQAYGEDMTKSEDSDERFSAFENTVKEIFSSGRNRFSLAFCSRWTDDENSTCKARHVVTVIGADYDQEGDLVVNILNSWGEKSSGRMKARPFIENFFKYGPFSLNSVEECDPNGGNAALPRCIPFIQNSRPVSALVDAENNQALTAYLDQFPNIISNNRSEVTLALKNAIRNVNSSESEEESERDQAVLFTLIQRGAQPNTDTLKKLNACDKAKAVLDRVITTEIGQIQTGIAPQHPRFLAINWAIRAKWDLNEIRSLLSQGVRLDAEDGLGQTPIQATLFSGRDDKAEVLDLIKEELRRRRTSPERVAELLKPITSELME